MYELAASNQQLENSLKLSNLIPNFYLLISKTCGGGVDNWGHKVCINTLCFTQALVCRIFIWVQNGIYTQFKHFYSSVLSTLFSDISSLFLIIYTPFPQALLLKKLSK